MLYYRADHLAEAGIEPPTTLAELRAAAEALTRDTDGDGSTDIYGLVQRGIPGFEIAQDFGRLLFANGGAILDETGSACVLTAPEGVGAIQLWADLFQSGYMPPDLFAIGRDEQIRQLQTGRASMGIYFSPYYGRLVDELDADQVGWAVSPTAEGVEAGRSLNTLWSLAIDRNSGNKDAAWQLVQWLSDVENQITMAVEFANAPVRESTYVDAAFIEQNPLGAEWLQATAASSFTPSHPRFPEMADAMSIELTAAIEGKLPDDRDLLAPRREGSTRRLRVRMSDRPEGARAPERAASKAAPARGGPRSKKGKAKGKPVERKRPSKKSKSRR